MINQTILETGNETTLGTVARNGSFNPLDYPICLAYPTRIAESAWLGHVPFAFFITDVLRPRVLVELGTHYGVSYCAFCQAVKELRSATLCYAVDTWQGDQHVGAYGPEVLQTLKEHHDPLYGSFSRLVQSSFQEALNHFADKTIDLLHIDGCHTYEAVKQDFESWLPKMTDRGVILFHDINVREYNFGVWKLWQELKQKYAHVEFMHTHGLGVLAVGPECPPALTQFMQYAEREPQLIGEFFYQLGVRAESGLKLQDQEDQLLKSRQELGQYKHQLEAKEQQLQDLGYSLREHQAWVKERDQQLQEHTQWLSDKDGHLHKLQQELQAHRQRLQEQQQLLDDKEQRLKRGAEQIEELTSKTQRQETQLKEFQQRSQEKDLHVKEEQQLLREKDLQIEEAEQKLRLKDLRIAEMEQIIRDKDSVAIGLIEQPRLGLSYESGDAHLVATGLEEQPKQSEALQVRPQEPQQPERDAQVPVLKKQILEQDARIAEQAQQLQAYVEMEEKFRQSGSYRLGRALSWPLRATKQMFE